MAEAAAEKNMDTTQPKSRPKTSVVWENFTETEKEGVQCNICKDRFAWLGSASMMPVGFLLLTACPADKETLEEEELQVPRGDGYEDVTASSDQTLTDTRTDEGQTSSFFSPHMKLMLVESTQQQVDSNLSHTIREKSRECLNWSDSLDRLGGGSAMNQCEEREEGAPPSKTTLWGEHESQTKVQSVQQQRSEVPIGQSAQQHQTQLDSIFMLLQENMISFVKEQLKEIQRVLTPNEPEYLESQRKDEDEEQRRSREAFLKITVNFLRRMKQEELADCLQRKRLRKSDRVMETVGSDEFQLGGPWWRAEVKTWCEEVFL
ncbi:hypothetical protein EPR50_G00164480 [Xyrichtys novacula]|uniref:Uncharacterized protein n=1 Tax=Xyrichtys novacula TaxID=13765 RepID=A0AAV1HNW6_XYRNO|nr:hypothetical protein EPR50_G00164480 [Xyrichtys novacula]